MKTLFHVIAVSLFLGLPLASQVHGDPQSKGRKGSAEQGPNEDRSISGSKIAPSGLIPHFPKEANCPDIASPFGSPTRYDGSSRPPGRYGGLHGGIDLSLEPGTPLRAIATGKIIHMGQGGMAEGIYVWLQIPPESSGLPFWVYAKYQHLVELPTLSTGTRVQAGQTIGLSGKTGTEGKHYGAGGYAHLHLTTYAGADDQFEIQASRVVAQGARFIDPLVLYVKGLNRVEDISSLPDERKHVPIPYAAEDGTLHPADSPVVWPVACKRR